MPREDAMTAVQDARGAASRRTVRARWRPLGICVAVAAVALTFAACGGGGSTSSSSTPIASAAAVTGLYGKLPPVGTPSKGGTITFGQITGSTPTYIFPILPGADASVFTSQEFFYNFFMPLYAGPVGDTPEVNYPLSLAAKPVFSDGNKTVTIQMKSNFKWSNGAPVDANDLLFDVDLIKQAVKESAANWSDYTPGFFPDSLTSIAATGKYTVVMHLKKAYNPSFFLEDQMEGAVFPLPSTDWNVAAAGGPHLDYTNPANAKKIYDYLSKAGGQLATIGTNPLWKDVDGPLVLSSFSATNSSYTATVNPSFSGSPKPAFAKFVGETYTGQTPEINALRTGSLDIALIDSSQLGAVPSLKSAGYSVYGYPDLGFNGAFFNFKDTTGHFGSIISQLYVRQALADLEDEPAYVQGIFKGAAALAYGPVPSAPPTPFTPADAVKTPYPYNPAAAAALLKSHGWKVVPGGQSTCAKAGSGAGECGAGIPAGTPFTFTWWYVPASFQAFESLESESFASAAKQYAGINVQLGEKTLNYIIANYNDADPADAKYTNDWGVIYFGGFTDSQYPTTNSLFNTTGDYNLGAYNSAVANGLINTSVYGSNANAVTNEASFLTKDPPILFGPNQDLVYAVSNKVGGPASSFLALTQYITYPQYWYLNK